MINDRIEKRRKARAEREYKLMLEDIKRDDERRAKAEKVQRKNSPMLRKRRRFDVYENFYKRPKGHPGVTGPFKDTVFDTQIDPR